MKKVFLLVFSMVMIIFVISIIVIGNSIKVEFYFNDLYPNFADKYIKEGENKEQSVKRLSMELGLNQDISEKICDNPDDYGLLILDYNVINNTPFKINYFSFFKNVSYKDSYIVEHYFEDMTLRKIKPHSSMEDYLGVAVIVKDPKTFNLDTLDYIKLKMLCTSNCGLFLSLSSSYMGVSGEDQLFILELENDLKNDEDYQDFFTLSDKTNKEYTLSSSLEYLSKSAARLGDKVDYRFSVFEDNSIKRYGFTFFEKNGYLIGGVLLSKVLPLNAFDSIEIGKSTYDNIVLIDQGTYLFKNKGDLFSYHYFEDGSYLKIIYKKDSNNVLFVRDVEKITPKFDWMSVLFAKDNSLIK